MSRTFNLFLMLSLEIILGSLLFGTLVSITFGIGMLLEFFKQNGLEQAFYYVFLGVEGFALLMEIFCFCEFVIKSTINFRRELRSE